MSGTWIEIGGADARALRGFLAVPASGWGPGILLLPDVFGLDQTMRNVAALYAEEGYVVLAPDLARGADPARLDAEAALADARAALATLRRRGECTGQVGALGFGFGGGLAWRLAARAGLDCAVAYDPVGIEADLGEAAAITCPIALQIAEEDPQIPPSARAAVAAALAGRAGAALHVYPGCTHGFAREGHAGFDKSAALMAHTRALTVFRGTMGPHYDLSALWEQHTALEFAARDADATMTTMVSQPYVNHIPTMTGGVGYTDLLRFYKHHFIPTTPPDAKLLPISRTIGVDRLVDEFIFSFTHDREIDWLLPGIPPTGRRVEVPMLAVVRFRGDKLYNEHIYWDQASVLVQVGLLDPGRLPVAGVETARKLLDESLPSNTMMPRWSTSAPREATRFGRIYPPDVAWLARQPHEEVLEPDLPIVDAHHHLWDRPDQRYLLEEYLADARAGHNLVATVFLQCHAMYRASGPEEMRPVGETEFVAGQAAMSDSGRYGPVRVAAGIVGFADLTLGERVTPVLEAQIRAGGGRFRGVRHSGNWDADPIIGNGASAPGLYQREDFRTGVRRLAALGLTLDAWTFHTQLDDVIALARAAPEATLVMGHVGGPLGYGPYAGKRDEVYAAWKAGITELAKCPNVVMKLGGMMMRLAAYDYRALPAPPSSAELAEFWRPWMEPCVELFGAGRCLFESNFPVEKMGTGWVPLWNAFKRIAGGASAAEKQALFAGTARRVYRLD